jgi:hypothetical protein
MSETLIDLMDDLHKMQTLHDFMIKGMAALSTGSEDKSLQLTENEAYQVVKCVQDMVDQMIRRVEKALREL